MYACVYVQYIYVSQGDFRLMSFTAGRCGTPLIFFLFIWKVPAGGGGQTSMTMPHGIHAHLLDFNEHEHSEDSMPRGAHIHFQKAYMSFLKKIPRKERKQKK